MKSINWSPWFLVLISVALVLSVVSMVTPGPTGPQGLIGPVGVQGLNGPPGMDGKDGTNGIDGAVGIQGAQGLTGIQGMQGVQGVKGEKGEPGRPGEIRREVTHLASMAVADRYGDLIGTASRGQEIEIWGADFHHEPQLRLYDSNGKWFTLGRADVEWHKFAEVVMIPDDAALGIAELAAMSEKERSTYHTIPIMIED